MSNLNAELNEDREIIHAATQGPWECEINYSDYDDLPSEVRVNAGTAKSGAGAWRSTDRISERDVSSHEYEDIETISADAEFIAESRTKWPLRNNQLAAVLAAIEGIESDAEFEMENNVDYAYGLKGCAVRIREAIELAS